MRWWRERPGHYTMLHKSAWCTVERGEVSGYWWWIVTGPGRKIGAGRTTTLANAKTECEAVAHRLNRGR